jgi:hypothetical protein
MDDNSGNIVDFGSYSNLDPDRCIEEKLQTLVLDEGGLKTPISVSLVIPTKLDISDSSELELEHDALHTVLAECGNLVDKGYIDEIIVIDATTNHENQVDYSTLRNVTGIAFEELELFKEQIKTVKKFVIEREKVKRGIFPFVFRAVHQFDQNIEKLLAQAGIIKYTSSLRMRPGKGSGLWLSVPICHGDVIAFIDSDILNFQKEFVIGLIHPIIYSWNEVTNNPSIKMVKAYYNRLTISKLGGTDRAVIGGRVTRLFMVPLINILVEKYGLHPAFKQIKYPLAGEIAASKSQLEIFEFPNNYAVEMSHLFQSIKLMEANSICLTNLEKFYHLGQSKSALYEMGAQILHAFKKYIPEEIYNNLSKSDFIDEYEKTAKILVKNQEQQVFEQIQEIEESDPYKPDYSINRDLETIEQFKLILAKSSEDEKKYNTTYLPSWDYLREKTNNYDFIKQMLYRRSVQSTYSRLKELEVLI